MAEDASRWSPLADSPRRSPDAPDDPVGEEIPDEYKDAVQGSSTPRGRRPADRRGAAAVDALVDSANEVIDADTWTDELQTRAGCRSTPLTQVCAATFATSATGG